VNIRVIQNIIAQQRPVAAGFSLRKKRTLKGAATKIFEKLIRK
jgi:hypothetical protein